MNRKEQKKRGYNYKREDLLTAFVIMPDPMRPGRPKGARYHNIPKAAVPRERFEAKVLSWFPGATHINYYGGVSGLYQFRTTFPKL